MRDKSIRDHLREGGLSRRDFVKFCGVLSGMMGLEFMPPVKALAGPAASPRPAGLVADALASKPLLPIIWLHLQGCGGCTEALSRSQSPGLVDLVLDKIALNYHETLMAAAGSRATAAMRAVMENEKGKYVLIVEGSPSSGAGGAFCAIGGRNGADVLREAASGAAAIIAAGSCAAFGGLPKADPNPTAALGIGGIILDRPVVNISGCAAITEVTTGTIVHYLVRGELPKTDGLKRPLAFYGLTIHDHCFRRPFYDAGKFAGTFDDAGARAGHCLYKLGCKGPTTHNACSLLKWEKGLSFPVQSGHPCLGCSEPGFWDWEGFYRCQSAPLESWPMAASGGATGTGIVPGTAPAGPRNP
ncbi:MAG: hydrogenase small subunit [Acidobacteriota bacterium]|nr:hydrogenase small subunit [Acidobacteriota bacterium]